MTLSLNSFAILSTTMVYLMMNALQGLIFIYTSLELGITAFIQMVDSIFHHPTQNK